MVAGAKMDSTLSMDLPPDPSSSENYELWRKDIQVWAKLTDTLKIKQGRALQYACRSNSKLHEAVLNIDDKVVDSDDGLENVIKVIDNILRKSNYQLTVNAYENFINLKKKPSQTLEEFLLDFDLVTNTLKKSGNNFSEELLFYKLLTSLSLTDLEEKLIKATVKEFTPSEMKNVLRKIFNTSSDLSITTLSVSKDQNNQLITSDENKKVGLIDVTQHRKRKNHFESCRCLNDLYQTHSKRSKDQKSPEHSSSPKRYPCHKCYSPEHWDAICKSKAIDENTKECPVKINTKVPTENNIFLASNSPNEMKKQSNSNNTSNLKNLEFKELNLFEFPRQVNPYKFIDKPDVTHFNEAVIIDIVKTNEGYVITFLDTYSSFAVSNCIEKVEQIEILDHIQNFWIDVFKMPYTFICSNNTSVSTLLRSDEDLKIPVLFSDETWVIDHLNNYYRNFTDNFLRIMKDTNCSMSHAALWASSMANSTSASSERQPPAFCAFEFIPLLPCIKGYKPPIFNSHQQYEVVLNNYFNALKMCYMKRFQF